MTNNEENEKARSTPMGFYHYAQSYREAANLLTNADKTSRKATHPEAPIRFLYYHAIELYLKAFLRTHCARLGSISTREHIAKFRTAKRKWEEARARRTAIARRDPAS